METLENRYYEEIVRKAYFDCFSHEFKRKTPDQKLLNMALYLHNGGDLHYAINAYKSGRDEYILSSLMTTLFYYLNYIRTGDLESIFSLLVERYLSEYQTISLLAAELKARLNYDFESNSDHSVMKKKYKIDIGRFEVEKYVSLEGLTKKERLIAIFKGDLPDDFDLGDFDENVPD